MTTKVGQRDLHIQWSIWREWAKAVVVSNEMMFDSSVRGRERVGSGTIDAVQYLKLGHVCCNLNVRLT